MAVPANGAATGGGYGGLVSGLGIASGLLNKRKDQSGAGLLAQMAMNPQLMRGLQGAFRQQPGQPDPTMLPPGQAPGGMPAGVRNPEMGGGAGVTSMGSPPPALSRPVMAPQPAPSPTGAAIDGRNPSSWSMDGDRPRWRAATQPLFGGGPQPAPPPAPVPQPAPAPAPAMPPPGMPVGGFQLPPGANLAGPGNFQMSDAPKFPPFAGGGAPPQAMPGSSGPPPIPMSKPPMPGGAIPPMHPQSQPMPGGGAAPPMHPMSPFAGPSGPVATQQFPTFQPHDPGMAAAGPPGQMGDPAMAPPIGMAPPPGMDPQQWARIQQQLASQGPGLGGGSF